ncbi:glycerol kinase GlpK [Bowmanella sp. JS7-9]|uniref:glycerol kinase GlpK n=1 Tax=Alteromonadaceae TaxID=72275 RepID=UPI0010392D66|nr:glycerol kinase GlpK [Bowmanella sp. JS7-9]TBX21376.1 glycerol kinase [Bowmanella sp. JS7-9]
MKPYLLSIDQGTTSSRAIIFDQQGNLIHSASQEFTQHYPQNGWVEHDPDDILQSVLNTIKQTLNESGITVAQISAIGICNQRETTLIWNKKTGKTIYNAIVWQDRRTAQYCHELSEQGHGELINAKTGLLIDAYFSATKIRWILDNVEGARHAAEQGELAFGTVDTFLLWHLTEGQSHFTDATNASRTLLYNIHTHSWDAELLALFDIPRSMLPEVKNSADDFGTCHLFGAPLCIGGIAGDQQAALIGQGCFTEGMAKSTYGTGCFLMVNTGKLALTSHNKLLTTIAYQIDGEASYAIEGSIFIAGAAVQWMRDNLHLFRCATDTEDLLAKTNLNHGVYFVPALTGLGAPYWDPDARGAISGLTRASGINEIVSAGIQSVGYQTKDLLAAIEQDGISIHTMRIDGGMAANNWFMQFLADILAINIERPVTVETSALGAAYLAGLHKGLFDSTAHIQQLWQAEQQRQPQLDREVVSALYQGWQDAVRKVLVCQ